MTDTALLSSLLVDNSRVSIYRYNYREKKYDYFSPTIRNLLGYSLDELNEKGFIKIVNKIYETRQDQHVIDDQGKKIIAEDYFGKYLVSTNSGEQKLIEDKAFIHIGEDGEYEFSIGILTDVTPLKDFMNSLKKDKEQNKTFLDLIRVMFFVLDSNFEIIFMNRAGNEILEYDDDEILGRKWFTFISEKTGDNIKSEFESILNGSEKNKQLQIPLITKNGHETIVDLNISPFKDDSEIKLIGSGHDITNQINDRKIQEVIFSVMEAANSEGDIDEFFKFLHSSIKKLMPAENFYIALYNLDKSLLTFPYFTDEKDKIGPVEKPFGNGLTEYVIRTGVSQLVDQKRDTELVKNDGVEVFGSPAAIWLGIPLKIQDTTIGAMVVQDYNSVKNYGEKEKEILELVSLPISRAIERKKMQSERVQYIEKLKELNATKDKLLSLISHDLRGPFNSLLGFSEILTTELETLTHEEVKEYLQVIYDTSKNLYSMTNNLLQYSRYQTGKFRYEPVVLNLLDVVNNNTSLLQGSAMKKHITVSPEIDPALKVFADEDMLNSILQNLISNGIKFTKRGGEIRIAARKVMFFEQTEQVEIIVEDTGVGMSKAEIQGIFEGILESKPGTEREYGTGLGLLLVKEFVTKNGGNLSIKSRLNHGSVFAFTLPVKE